MNLKTVSFIFVYNDILTGELNIGPILEYLSKWITALGYTLKKVSIINENEPTIISELENFSKHFDIVFILTNPKTTFIGKLLATLFSDDLIVNKHICKKLQLDKNVPWPKSIKYKETCDCITLYYQRIFVLTWEYLDKQINLIKDHLQNYQRDQHLAKMFFLGENTVLPNVLQSLNPIQYLEIDCHKDKVVTLHSQFLKFVVEGEIRLRQQIASSATLYSKLFIDMEDAIWNSPEPHIRLALESIAQCLHEYGPKNTFISFNGGKDCTVLQHLYQIVMRKKYPNENHRLLCLYVKNENTFKEQDEFIEQCSIYYNLEIMSIDLDIKSALSQILNKRPNLKACLMGQRRTDPYCADLITFKMTDASWPQVMRCNPILDWHYADIWDYLLYYKVPYCDLYDHGFTSLGSSLNTVPNPSLVYKMDGTVTYLPAYRLLREDQERDGRNVSVLSKM